MRRRRNIRVWRRLQTSPHWDHLPDFFTWLSRSHDANVQDVEGVSVRVFDPAKTVADCFRHRNKIGLDVAVEALRDCYRQRQATMDELWKVAKSVSDR